MNDPTRAKQEPARSSVGVDIFYPNDGFLYYPLLLADELGILPDHATLTRVATDRAAVDQVRRSNAPARRIQLAICDPIAGDIGRLPADGGHDHVTLAGTVITGIPLWLCNTDPTIPVTKDEATLAEAKGKVAAIISYPEGTTSRVFAKRLKSRVNDKTIRHVDSDFGEEWNTLETICRQNSAGHVISSDKVFVLTADVLRVVATAQTDEHLVYDYHVFSKKLGLYPYLFTGILCRHSALDRDLLPVLEVIHAMSAVVRLVRTALIHTDRASAGELMRAFSKRFPLERVLSPSALNQMEEADRFDIYRRALDLLMAAASDDPANI